jgi:hypothetical protein
MSRAVVKRWAGTSRVPTTPFYEVLKYYYLLLPFYRRPVANFVPVPTFCRSWSPLLLVLLLLLLLPYSHSMYQMSQSQAGLAELLRLRSGCLVPGSHHGITSANLVRRRAG